MRIINTIRLNNGKGFNQGQPSSLIQIEDPADYDLLEANILSTDYYGRHYFETRISHQANAIKPENLLAAAMVGMLEPGAVLELGCGRGDILLLLSLAGVAEVRGIDLSQDVVEAMWPRLKGQVLLGDLLGHCRDLAAQGRRFDTVAAFDIWEHLHPARLGRYIEAVLDAAAPDALFYFVIPAFGPDRCFGEVFPLEYEENRADLEAGRPFTYLLADSLEPPIPVNGHLIWAPCPWWEEQFTSRGLTRAVELEQAMHRLFDDHLFYAQKTFFIFHRGQASRARLDRIVQGGLDQLAKVRRLACLFQGVRGLEKEMDTQVLDGGKTLLDIHHGANLAVGRPRARAEVLAPLLGSVEVDPRYQDLDSLRLLKQLLHLDLVRLQEILYEQAEEWTGRCPGILRPPVRKVLRGLARRRFERWRDRLLAG